MHYYLTDHVLYQGNIPKFAFEQPKKKKDNINLVYKSADFVDQWHERTWRLPESYETQSSVQASALFVIALKNVALQLNFISVLQLYRIIGT